MINEIGGANGAWNTVQVAIMANTTTGGANPIGSYSGGRKTLKSNQLHKRLLKSTAT